MFGDKCPWCQEDMKSPYGFKDSKGEWHYAHKNCCNQLKRNIEQIYEEEFWSSKSK